MIELPIFDKTGVQISCAKVDNELAPYLNQVKWCMKNKYPGNSNLGFLHRCVWELLGKSFTPNHYIDHKNFDTLDATDDNLREVNASVSSRHQAKKEGCTSIFRGVSWNTQNSKWVAQIQVKDVGHVHLGYHEHEVTAAMYYKSAVHVVHGVEYEIENDLPIIQLPSIIVSNLSSKTVTVISKEHCYYVPKTRKWISQIRFNKKQLYLGSFATQEEAARVSVNRLELLQSQALDDILKQVEYVDYNSAIIPWGKHKLKLQVDHKFVRFLINTKQQSWNRNGYPTFLFGVNTIPVHKWVILQENIEVKPLQVIDHKDGDIFNASTSNLWACSRSENSLNVDAKRNNWNGVILRGGQWWAHVNKRGKLKRWGPFIEKLEATKTYKSNS